MYRRSAIVAVLAMPLAGLRNAAAQLAGPARQARVGWITASSGATPGALEAFREGLRERGWVEGRNLLIDQRSGDRSDARRLHDELKQAGAEVIVATGAVGLDVGLLARELPVIFVIGGDPVEAGLVDSMARPQGNRTGMTLLSYELIGKRMELVKQLLPGLQRVGYLHYEKHAGAREELRLAGEAARMLGLALLPLPLNSDADVAPALQRAERERLQALLAATDSLIARNAARIAAQAGAAGVPVISGWGAHVADGFLLSYGAGVRSFFQHLAGYADRSLRGVRVADMPAETPPRVELVLNRRAASQLGLALPPALLARVDQFIDAPR